MSRWLQWTALSVVIVTSSFATAQPPAPDTADDNRERIAAERFLSVLERQPRFGTALDKVYAYHIERGTIDDFLAEQRKKTSDNQQAGAAWMVIGLVEFQRGHDVEAASAFREAEKLRTEDALASYYLGRSLLLVGKTDDAAQAFERAVTRKPGRTDLLEIFQALGQIYQRSRRTQDALAVWNRLEQGFPDDQRVQEQIAGILADEGDHAGALVRFEQLARKAADPYRKVQYQLKVGELKLRLGQTEEALADLEKILGQLKPDSWLYRDVRQRIEGTFLRTDDYEGLAKYYESWLAKHPDDVDAMARLGRVLGLQGRFPEAEPWFRKALKLSPSNKSLRSAFIDQLVQVGKLKDAASEYAELDRLEPNNPDTLRAWGQLLLEDKSRPDAERKQQSADVWRKLLAAKPKDAVITSQVADLFRHAKLSEDAIALYRQAIALAPNDPQYREYLGEYLHSLERGPEAIAVWQEIAAGSQRNTKTLVRLAEVLRGFGYRSQAVATMGEACGLKPEFADIVRYAVMLRDETLYDEALAQLDRAGRLAENDEERDHVLGERIRTYVDSDRLTPQIAALEKAVESQGTAGQWRTLALLYEAARRSNDAGRAIARAVAADNQSPSTWIVAARLYESTGMLAQAVEANQKLAALDRRARSDYLQRVANLCMRLGRVNDALQAGQEVIASAPGNPEHYQFYAQLCFQVGKANDGLDALRRAVRVNPSDAKALITLAGALADQFRTDEAVELYWRAFEAAEDLDGRNAIVTSLTELYLRTNHLDRLVSRLTRLGQEQKNEREATLWLATAHQAAGDLGTARDTLSKLVDADSKDTQLLMQLVRLAESDYDLDAAVSYQRRIVELAPSREAQLQLAGLLLRSGATEEAEALWLELAAAHQEPHKIYDAIDDLLRHDRFTAALKMAERVLRDDSQDWEALYRAGVADWKLGNHDASIQRLENLRALPIPHDRPSAKATLQKAQAQSRSASTAAATAAQRSGLPANYPATLLRSNVSYYIQYTFNTGSERSVSTVYNLWAPTSFGDACLAAPGARFMQLAANGKIAEAVTSITQRLKSPDLSTEELWDVYLLASLAQRYTGNTAQQTLASQVIRRLSELDDAGGKVLYLSNLRSRQVRRVVNGVTVTEPAAPLADADLNHVLACYRWLKESNPDWLDSYITVAPAVAQELKVAKREVEAEAVFRDTLDRATTPRSLYSVIETANVLGRMNELVDVIDRLAPQLQTQPSTYGTISAVWLRLTPSLIEKKDWTGVTTIIGRALDARAAELAAMPRQRRYTPTKTVQPISVAVPSTGGAYRSVRLEFPPPNSYFDQQFITQLYSIFEQFKQNKVEDQLLTSLAARAESGTGDGMMLSHLAIAYCLYWADRKDDAADRLQRAVNHDPGDPALRLQLAELYLKRNNPGLALAAADAFEPSEFAVLRDRELVALQAAVSLNQLDRARHAAEQLAGMQLDPGIQLQLAQTMRQLGMRDEAEGVLTRLRKRAGNQSGTLVQLMRQYQTEGNKDVAGQIAQQLLRRSKPSSLSPSSPQTVAMRDDANSRQQALQVLNSTGQLSKMIARQEAQLEKSPNSASLLESLAEFYKAAGQNDKSQQMLERLTQQQPKDGRSLYTAADQLYRANNTAAACDMYLKALKADPSRLEDRYYDIANAFRRAKRTKDLAAVLLEIDLQPLGRISYRISDIVGELAQQNETRDAGVALFRRAWDAFPDQRISLIGRIYNDDLWQTDEMFNYALQAVVPVQGLNADPWRGIADTLSYNSDGRVTGLLTRLVQATKKPEHRQRLTKEVAAALKTTPDWRGGEAILAVLDAMSGDTASAGQRVDKLLKDASIPGRSALVLGQELGELKVLTPQSIRLLELAVANNDSGMDEYSYHPARYLAKLHHQSGDRHLARQCILDALAKADYSRYGSSNPGYGEYQELQSLFAAGQDLVKMELPLDAVRLYHRAMADPAKFKAAERWGGGDYLQQQITRGEQAAQKAITPQALSEALGEWVRVPVKPREGDAKPKPPLPVVDFALAVQPTTVDTAALVSLFETAVLSATGETIATVSPVAPQPQPNFVNTFTRALSTAANAAASPASTTPKGPRQAETLDKLRQQLRTAPESADDLSLRVAAALVELLDPVGEPPTSAALQRVVEAVQAIDAKTITPTETQLAVWLVARRAVRHSAPEVQKLGNELGDWTMQVAGRHPDRLWQLAMLREQGQAALDAGNPTAAEHAWSRMLDAVLRVDAAAEVKPQPRPRTSAAPGGF